MTDESPAGAPLGAGPFVLALDIGTSSVRASIYDREGQPVQRVRRVQLACRWRTTDAGGMEIRAGELMDQVFAALDEAVSELRRERIAVAAVGIATFWHSLLGTAQDGKPLTPVYGWGDTRARSAVQRLHELLDEATVHRRTGCFFHPSYPSAKLVWLRETMPGTFRDVRWWVGFGEHLALELFGQRACSLSMASATGLLDVHRLAWDDEMLSATGIGPQALFPLAGLDSPQSPLRSPYASRWPELAHIPWLPAVGDGACANIGSGAVGDGILGLTVGTSAALRSVRTAAAGADLEVPFGLWAYRLDASRWVTGGALSNGGSVVAYLERTLALAPAAQREAALAGMRPDGHGLTVLPLLLGERSPGWHPSARAAIVGATQDTQPLELLRASLEAVALRLSRVHSLMEGALGSTLSIIGSGGALHASAAWTQIICDALQRPLTLPSDGETTSRGAALLALEHIGAIDDVGSAQPCSGSLFRPDPSRAATYDAAAARQQELETLLLPWMEKYRKQSDQ